MVPTGKTRGLLRTALIAAQMKHANAGTESMSYPEEDDDSYDSMAVFLVLGSLSF